MLILSGQSHPQLAASLAKSLPALLIRRTISRFPDQTFRIKINSDVKGKTVIIVQTLTHPIHDNLIELLLLADAAKSAGGKKIIAVIPYLSYSKQDQIFLPGEPLSVRVVAQVLSRTSIDEIITLELHHPYIAKFFSVPIRNLSFLPTLIHETKRNNLITNKLNELISISPTTTVVVAPDSGAVSRAQLVADQLRLPLITIDKSRNLFTGKVNIKRTVLATQGLSLKDLKDKHCLIVDDLIVTGDTLAAAAKFLKTKGGKTISVFATHGLLALQSRSLRARGRRPPAQSKRTAGFTNGFQKLRSAGINSITISDSIPHKKLPSWIKTISSAPLLTEAIKSLTKN